MDEMELVNGRRLPRPKDRGWPSAWAIIRRPRAAADGAALWWDETITTVRSQAVYWKHDRQRIPWPAMTVTLCFRPRNREIKRFPGPRIHCTSHRSEQIPGPSESHLRACQPAESPRQG